MTKSIKKQDDDEYEYEDNWLVLISKRVRKVALSAYSYKLLPLSLSV